MEIILVLLIYLGFGYVLYKVAKSKNREPAGWILAGVILAPIMVIVSLAIMPSLPGKKKVPKKSTGTRYRITR